MLEKFLSRFATFEDEDYNDFDYDFEEERIIPMQDERTYDISGAQNRENVSPEPNAHAQIVVLHPKSMDIAEEVANYVREGRMVVCNFEHVEQRIAQRVVDFMTGAAYSLDGRVHAISDLIFMVVPQNVNLMDEFLDEEPSLDFLRKMRG